MKSESDSLFSNLIMKALKAIKGFEMIISIQPDLLQEKLSVSVIEVKTSLTEFKLFFLCFSYVRKSYTSSDWFWIRLFWIREI